MQGQIAQSKKNNSAIAQFLAMLFQRIDDPQILGHVHQIFFVRHDGKSTAAVLKNDIYALILMGLFVPFFVPEAEQFGLKKTYQKFYNFDAAITLTSYISSIESLMKTYKASFLEHTQVFVSLLTHIMFYFSLVDSNMTPEQQKKLQTSVTNELFAHADRTAKHDHMHRHTHDSR